VIKIKYSRNFHLLIITLFIKINKFLKQWCLKNYKFTLTSKVEN